MKDINSRLEEITELFNFRLFHIADKKINAIYEDYTQNHVEMDEDQVEWMFNLIDAISTALYG